jgi:tRNA G18 (ribose-2'-O)-methylase SpoU
VRIDPVAVTTADDPRVEAYLRLTDMDLRQRVEPERGVFMAEGHLIIERCAEFGMGFQSVLTSPRWLDRLASSLVSTDVDVYVADEALLEDITGYRVHRGALAVIARPAATHVDEVLRSRADVLVLEDLVDPTNVGLAIRSAVVQGINDVILSPGCADPLYRRAVKSSMGAVLRCRWARSDAWPETLSALARLRRVVALEPDAVDTIDATLAETTTEPVALMVGSEGPGLSAEALASSWRRARIPMATAEDSLNVAAATAVACYARAQSRRDP